MVVILLFALIIAAWWALVYFVVRSKRGQYDRARRPYERSVAVAGPPETALATWRARHDSWLSMRGFFPSAEGPQSVQYHRRALSVYMTGVAILFFPIGTVIAFRSGREADTLSANVQRAGSGALVHFSGVLGPAAHRLLQDLPGGESPSAARATT